MKNIKNSAAEMHHPSNHWKGWVFKC